MGYQCIAGYKVGHGVYQVMITESTNIAQLALDGTMLMMDREDLEKAKIGTGVFTARLNLETGKVTTNKYTKLSKSIIGGGWVDHVWKHEYESEKDWS